MLAILDLAGSGVFQLVWHCRQYTSAPVQLGWYLYKVSELHLVPVCYGHTNNWYNRYLYIGISSRVGFYLAAL